MILGFAVYPANLSRVGDGIKVSFFNYFNLGKK